MSVIGGGLLVNARLYRKNRHVPTSLFLLSWNYFIARKCVMSSWIN